MFVAPSLASLRRRVFVVALRYKSDVRSTNSNANIHWIDELNRMKSKDLRQIFDENQTKCFLQLKRSLGGEFHSLDEIHKEKSLSVDVQKLMDYLTTLNIQEKSGDSRHRIHIEPRLTPKAASEIDSVCSVDFTASHINWAYVKATHERDQFQVEQWNSRKVDFDKKFHFIKTFDQLSEELSTIAWNQFPCLLLEQSMYRYRSLQIAQYIGQLQQIRAVFHTLLHCQVTGLQSIYHISSRDVASHFRLFIGNEQSSAEFFLTNLIFKNATDKSNISLTMDQHLKTNFYQPNKGQREPMALCLLRALAFLQCINDKKSSSSSPKKQQI